MINREELPKVLQRDIEELESYYHSGDFVGYDCCLETLEATVKQCCIPVSYTHLRAHET